jgi:hypothetical protein
MHARQSEIKNARSLFKLIWNLKSLSYAFFIRMQICLHERCETKVKVSGKIWSREKISSGLLSYRLRRSASDDF